MSIEKSNILFGLRPVKIFFPIIIGLGFVVFMLIREFEPGFFTFFRFSWHMVLWLFVAILFMFGRDLGYIIRLRILTDHKLSWLQSFRVIMLWEFTSAVTPSAIGGTSVAILYVNKEGITIGKSSATVMATSFLDELYFILMFPVLLAVVGAGALFDYKGDETIFNLWNNELFYFAATGYAIKIVYLMVLSYGLFINPRGLKWLLLMIFKLPVLRKWKQGANRAGTDIIKNSVELKHKPLVFWFKAFLSTFLSWTSRYFVVNAILIAFFFNADQLLIFARQLVMWIMMLVSPTPGGSGFAEFVFTRFLSEFIHHKAFSVTAIAMGLALIWRLISYYPYLFIGAIILPRWIKKHFVHRHKTS